MAGNIRTLSAGNLGNQTIQALLEAEQIRHGLVSSPSYHSFSELLSEVLKEMEDESGADDQEDELLQG